jgi:Phage-related protein, tail component
MDTYDIKVTRQFARSDSMLIQDGLFLTSITEVIQGTFIYPNTALLGLRIKATGQLYGNVPNITTTLRGTKIGVPSMSAGIFENCFYDNTQARWENSAGAEVTWDETTYTTAWSENAMCIVRDLMINSRYGIGRYISSSDLYTSGIIDAIQKCHIEYNPFYGDEPDYLGWYADLAGNNWTQKWTSTPGVTSNATAKTITGASQTYYTLTMNTTMPLPVGASCTFEIVFSSLPSNTDITISGSNSFMSGSQKEFGDITWAKGASTRTLVFTNTIPNMNTIILLLRMTPTHPAVTRTIGFTITDISLTATIRDHYHTWNGVMESEQAALMALFEMCDAFRCWPIWFDGKFNFYYGY